MAVTVIVGAQFGDESKGKVVDLLCDDGDIVARYQGGSNAGHTIYHHGLKYILHLVPSSITNPKVISLIGKGVDTDLIELNKELAQLKAAGVEITPKNFLVSQDSFVTTPINRYIDYLGDLIYNIGTTGSGMGPTEASRITRNGLRIKDYLDKDFAMSKLSREKEFLDMQMEFLLGKFEEYFSVQRRESKMIGKRKFEAALPGYYGPKGLDIEKIVNENHVIATGMQPHIINTDSYVRHFIDDGGNLIAEGAQGAGLDVDHGTYPYVTVSSVGPAGVQRGLAIPYSAINRVIGVVKLVPSRVGEGPFIGEFCAYDDIREEERLGFEKNNPSNRDEVMKYLQDRINSGTATGKEMSTYFRNIAGPEFGATTGRPRRLGVLDLALVAEHAKIHGFTDLALSKLDAYSGIKEIRIITAYEMQGNVIRPIYTTMKGFGDVSSIRNYGDLPAEAKKLIHMIEYVTKTPVMLVSVGPEREQTIRLAS